MSLNGRTTIEAESTALLAAHALIEKKADEVLVFDMRGRSDITDFVLIASGSSPPHLKALSEDLQMRLKQDGVRHYRISGEPDSGWMVLDYVDVVIHVFDPPTRGYYALEALWHEVPRLALPET